MKYKVVLARAMVPSHSFKNCLRLKSRKLYNAIRSLLGFAGKPQFVQ